MNHFVCVGPGRSGTSWLYEVLREQKEVCLAQNVKETEFFNTNYQKGLLWYKNFFNYCGGAVIAGEISNRYIFDKSVAGKIFDFDHNCKIIICMRNPYHRLQSVYSFKLREGALNCSFSQALKKMPELRSEMEYHPFVEQYYNTFRRDNIFILNFDRIESDPEGLMKDLFCFLGLKNIYPSKVANRKVNRAIVPRVDFFGGFVKNIAITLRYFKLFKILTALKRSDFVKSIFFKECNYKDEKLLDKIDAELKISLNSDLEKMQKLTGDSYSHWML